MAEIIVRPRAESDILSQVEYYEDKHVGLGGNFSICIDDGMKPHPCGKLCRILHK